MQDPGAVSYEKYLSGDDQGMVELIRTYRDGLILYLYSITGSMEDAEELAMDTFVRLGVRRPKNKGTAGFKTWLYTIGRRLAIDRLRKRRLLTVPLEQAQLADDGQELECRYIRQQEKLALHRLIRRLQPQYRQILWLVYFEDFFTEQAARALGKSKHAAQMQLHRAKQALGRMMEQEGCMDAQP